MKRIIIHCLIFVVILVLPVKGLKSNDDEYFQNIRESAGIHYTRARDYYRKGEYSKARAEFQKVLKLAPEHQGARWYLKSAEKELAKYEKTFRSRREKIRQLKAEKREVRKKLRRHLAQGRVHYYRKQYEQAIEDFSQALLIDPEYLSAEKYIYKCQKGIERQEQRKLQAEEKAAAGLKKTTAELVEKKEKEELEEIEQLYEKGKTYFRRGLYSEAITYFEKVIELGGNP